MLTKTTATIQMVVLFLFLTLSLFAHFENKDFLKLLNPFDIEKSMSKDEVSNYINFITGQSFLQIKEKARKSNKPIFLDFYANWCGPCNIMDREVFNDPSVVFYMNTNFINYKADVNTRIGDSLASRYDVKLLPTLIIISADGEILTKESKLMDSTEFIRFAKGAIM
ncbi:MAG: thiol:disulfide interchange protein [Maribacter sp.]|jgi:thiol:disulfide interchange protein